MSNQYCTSPPPIGSDQAEPVQLSHAERTALVESCLPMARKVAGKYCRRNDEANYDDAHAEALAILWETALKFDPARSSFANFAWDCLNWRLSRWRYERTHQQEPLSLSAPRNADDPDGGTLADDITDHREPSAHDLLEAKELLAGIRHVPGKHDPQILRALAEGKSAAEYAKEKGISRWRSSQITRRARLRLAKVAKIEVDDHGRRTAS